MIIMEKYIEGVGYYSSCIIFFNIIFALKMLTDGVLNIEVKSIYSFLCIDLFTFLICLLLLLVGIIFTVLITKEDDNIVDNNTSGKVIRIIAAKEITADNYFTNFSLLVLTGLSIPSNKGWTSTFIYMFIIISLGIVYIKKEMFYMNPILTLLNYNTFKCKDTNEKQYIILIKGSQIKENSEIRIQNINKHIIRLNHSMK